MGGVKDGEDVDEVRMKGVLDLGIVSGFSSGDDALQVGVRGGLYADVNANLNDPNQDGRVHLFEFGDIIDEGFDCIFDLEGKVTAKAYAFAKLQAGPVTVFDKEFDFGSATLVEFKHHCEIGGPNLGSVNNGVLTLNLNLEGNDEFKITSGPEGAIVVTRGDKVTQSFLGVNSIAGNAGAGDDSITVESSVTLPVNFDLGDGNDTMILGQGFAIVRGGNGDDKIKLRGNAGGEIFGDAGNDELTGAGGRDVLSGGDGNDTLKGARGDDELHGDDGDDTLYGDRGGDRLFGDRGNDRLLGNEDNDFLDGGEGNDSIEGGAGNDEAFGGDGNDRMIGEDGVDQLHGGAGDDYLNGGLANDQLWGDEGDDTLDGDRHNDLLRGGDGDDSLFGGFGSDELYGENGMISCLLVWGLWPARAAQLIGLMAAQVMTSFTQTMVPT